MLLPFRRHQWTADDSVILTKIFNLIWYVLPRNYHFVDELGSLMTHMPKNRVVTSGSGWSPILYQAITCANVNLLVIGCELRAKCNWNYHLHTLSRVKELTLLYRVWGSILSPSAICRFVAAFRNVRPCVNLTNNVEPEWWCTTSSTGIHCTGQFDLNSPSDTRNKPEMFPQSKKLCLNNV